MKNLFKNFLNRTSGKEASFKANNETIKTVINEWFKNPKPTEHKYGHISKWDTSEVTNMRRLFYKKSSFNQAIGDWDVSKVISMEEMFGSASSFNQDISSWDVSSVANMKAMFLKASKFNQAIENWDVSNVSDVMLMFYDATAFNQNLSGWNVDNVAYCSNFCNKNPQWILPKPIFANYTP